MRIRSLMVGLLLIAITAAAVEEAAKSPGTNLSRFDELSKEEKAKFIWDLFDKKQFDKPENKGVCAAILKNPGLTGANVNAFVFGAIDLAQKHDWKDLQPHIQAIYDAPPSAWIYERTFRYLRTASGKPVPIEVIEATKIIEASGAYRNQFTDEQLSAAQAQLRKNPDKDAVMVYCLVAAGWHAGKGGSERGRIAAMDILRSLDRTQLLQQLTIFRKSFSDDVCKKEMEWVTNHLHNNKTE